VVEGGEGGLRGEGVGLHRFEQNPLSLPQAHTQHTAHSTQRTYSHTAHTAHTAHTPDDPAASPRSRCSQTRRHETQPSPRRDLGGVWINGDTTVVGWNTGRDRAQLKQQPGTAATPSKPLSLPPLALNPTPQPGPHPPTAAPFKYIMCSCVSARMVPPSSTESGMTLYASPACGCGSVVGLRGGAVGLRGGAGRSRCVVL